MDALLFVMLWLLYTGSKYYNKLLRCCSCSEDMECSSPALGGWVVMWMSGCVSPCHLALLCAPQSS